MTNPSFSEHWLFVVYSYDPHHELSFSKVKAHLKGMTVVSEGIKTHPSSSLSICGNTKPLELPQIS
jgi:hypothetical protein